MSIMAENTIIEQREEFMVPSNHENHNKTPKSRKAHFLKPIIDPKNQTFPKPPSFSLPSIPNFTQINSWVTFKGRPQPQKNWDTWVSNLQQTHQKTWQKVGIFKAIKASIYRIKWDNELIMGLAQKWCPISNTFVFPWGECTLSLEDMMVLGGFSILGNSVRNPSESIDFDEIERNLKSFYSENSMKMRQKAKHYDWMKCFMGVGGEFEHIAFLVLWLSRYVFVDSCYVVSPHVFPIAISLARGVRIALAPAVLGSIYRDLSLLKDKIVGFVNGRDDMYVKLVVFAPFQFVQLWGWERFPALCPPPMSLLHGEPRLARWKDLRRLKNKVCMVDFESLCGGFLWRPYTLCRDNWELPEFYCDEARVVLLNSEVGDELLSFARCLRPCELVGLDCIEQYCPHRVARQFGLDQDVPRWTPRLNDNVKLAWNSYNMVLDGVKLYVAPLLVKGDVTVRYLDWSRKAFSGSCTNITELKQRKSPRYTLRGPRFELSKSLDEVEEDQSECHTLQVISSCDMASSSSHSMGEVRPIPNLETAIDNAVSWMNSLIEKLQRFRDTSIDTPLVGISRVDLLIEKLKRCREICVNIRDVDSVVDEHIETIPSCRKSISSNCDNCYQGLKSQSKERMVVDEVASSMSSPLLDSNKHSAGTSARVEALIADNDDINESGNLMESDNNRDVCVVSPNDEEDNVDKYVNVKLMEGSAVDPVIIADGDEDAESGDFVPYKKIESEIKARICRLDKVVSMMKTLKEGLPSSHGHQDT